MINPLSIHPMFLNLDIAFLGGGCIELFSSQIVCLLKLVFVVFIHKYTALVNLSGIQFLEGNKLLNSVVL